MKQLAIIFITVTFIGCTCLNAIADESGTAQTTNRTDTAQLQDDLLTKINHALTKGFISPEQASGFKQELNHIGAEESKYKSLSLPIPKKVVQQDIDKLNDLSANVEKQLPHEAVLPAVAFDTMHADTDRLISQALASSKITTSQAEQYYSRLAQIENELESLRNELPIPDNETEALTKDLLSLHDDLQKKLK